MNEPVVSIIIATFNSHETLKFAIKSIINQDYPNFEILIIGDCCNDNSEELVNSFLDKRLIWKNLAKNSGSQSLPNSEGMRMAKGKYIAFLGHDDIWFPNHLSTLIESIETNSADFVYCLSVLLSPTLNHSTVGQKNDFSELAFTNGTAHIPPSSWLFKKEIYATCGDWINPSETYLPIDVEYLKRIVSRNYKISFADSVFIAKFPSPWWQLYSKKNDFPQEKYFSLIQSNKETAANVILKECADAFGQKYSYLHSIREAFRILIKSLYYSLINLYGINRFPMNKLLLFKSKVDFQNNRIRRGLTAKKD
jgi:glycosyltransferase involved in cell wall biosynthesis